MPRMHPALHCTRSLADTDLYHGPEAFIPRLRPPAFTHLLSHPRTCRPCLPKILDRILLRFGVFCLFHGCHSGACCYFVQLSCTSGRFYTSRLKSQHFKGADVGHLSRITVSNILLEVGCLRDHFRFLLEDEKVVTACTRKDLRLFSKVVKDVFSELDQLRVAMNGIILDPPSAVRVSELPLNPGLAEGQKARDNGAQGSATAWMAPISKLFLPSGIVKSDGGSSSDRVSMSQSGRPGAGPNLSRPPKLAPKLGPALGASTTTVNVEFSGAGVGRAVTNLG